jgi:hypothetical protein
MRKILFIFFLVPFISLGQDKEIIELRNELNTVKENLNSHHKEFITGVVVSIVGGSVTIIGSITAAPALAIIGSITCLFGTGIIIDSDKWFGKKYMKQNQKKSNSLEFKDEKEVDDILRDYYLDFSKIENKQYQKINIDNIKTSIFRYDFINIVTNENTFYGVFSSHGKEQLQLYYLTNNNSTYRLINYYDIIEINKL